MEQKQLNVSTESDVARTAALSALVVSKRMLRDVLTAASVKLCCGADTRVERRQRAARVERPKRLDFNGFRNRQGVFKFNAQIPNGAVHLRMSQQELNSTQVARLLVNLGDLRSPH